MERGMLAKNAVRPWGPPAAPMVVYRLTNEIIHTNTS